MASEEKKTTGIQPSDAAKKTSKSEQEKIDKLAMEMAEKADRDTIADEEADPEDQEFTKQEEKFREGTALAGVFFAMSGREWRTPQAGRRLVN
jgi:hypothetical protein